MRAQAIRIIGIDPGLRRTGWGIVEADGVRLVYVASGLITSNAEDDLAYRLRELYEGLVGVIASFQADIALKKTSGQIFTDGSAMMFPVTGGFVFKL